MAIEQVSTVVYTPAQLSAAVSVGSIYDHVYLGADITLSSGIVIDPNKTSLIIDGLYDGVTHTLTDMNSTSASDTIGITSQSSIDLTFQNMVMTGRNYYGIPYIAGDSIFFNNSNVTVTYRNIRYSGPQITYHPDGLTRYDGCDITISPTASIPAEEIGEVHRVEFSGNNTIQHNSTSDAAFWFRGTVGTSSLSVLADANVTIRSSNYFMYARVSAIAPYTANPVSYTIQSGASFSLETNHGISLGTLDQASSFTVGANASFRYIQTVANGTVPSLYLNGALTVNSGASVYMQANFANAQPLIHFTTNNTPITISNPKSFVLYKSTGAALSFAASTTRAFTISGGQLNYWETPAAMPGAGGFLDIPLHKWHKPDWSTFTVSGTVTPTATTVTSSSFTPEELEDLPNFNTFLLHYARVLSVGDLPVTVDTIADDGRPITGHSEPNANIKIEYTVDGTAYVWETQAGADGSFTIITTAPIPANTSVTVSANTPFLITVIEASVAEVGELGIESAPERIVFGIRPVSYSPLYLPRTDPTAPVVISDTRVDESQWELSVAIDGPLTSTLGDTLDDALVFVETGEPMIVLSTTPTDVYTGGPGVTPTNVFWNVEEGILVHVTEPIRSNVEYSAKLLWTVRAI